MASESKVSSPAPSHPSLWLLAVAVIAALLMIALMVPAVLPAIPYPIQNLGVRAVVILVLLFIWLGCLLYLFVGTLAAQGE
jgi:hypothetical protein